EVLGALHRSRHHLVRRKTNLTDRSRTAVLAGFEAGYLAAFLWGITGLRNGTVSFGLMTAYLQLAAQIQRPTAQLARLLPQLIQSHTAFSRLADIDRLPVEPEPVGAEQTEDTQPVGIALRNITFAYGEQEPPVFRHFSHTFPPGSHTAIMGITGTGKSTLLRLLLALLQPQEGEMELYSTEDGKRKATPISAATRSQMVYVPQGNSLLSGTIRQNLLLGKPDATEEEMWAALHTAAADFVADLRDGLDTRCGEHGHRLSEGQAQRIAIARGLLRRGAVLLLDEISASLDEQTETLLMSRLAEARRSHTVLFVTHRSSVLAYCDHTLRLASLERTVLSTSKNRSFRG
ncbi:MAG: ATP-binding cassette domain-containing protein, partial [Prevotella sp.]|nr:ATP-binding cassette domain-containing protein [Prevotella sp.]